MTPMRFRTDPVPPPARSPDRRWWLPVLFASAAITAVATKWPWTLVRFERLFGHHDGPPGWHTTAGFTALCSGVLVAVMALAETRTPETQRAVRPGSFALVALGAIAMVWEVLAGPGMIRGVTAARTAWFWLACAGMLLLFLVCTERFRALRRRTTG